MHSKFTKTANMTLKKGFSKTYMGYQKRRFLNFFLSGFYTVANVFGYNFFRNIFLLSSQNVESAGNSAFFVHVMKFLEFFVILVLFAHLNPYVCSKNGAFSNNLQKVRSYCFANIYQSQFESHQGLEIEGP